MSSSEILLASQSPRRQELMRLTGYPFTVCISEVDETVDLTLPLEVAIEDIAARKASAVSHQYPENIVIGADTIVTIDGKILGKPVDPEDACRILLRLSGRTHRVVTGVCIRSLSREIRFHESTEVTFYPITEDEIRRYVATGEPMDKAGAYGIQGLGALFVRGISGDYHSVVGFPVARVYRELRGFAENSSRLGSVQGAFAQSGRSFNTTL